MIYGNYPEFDVILEILEKLEEEINFIVKNIDIVKPAKAGRE
jgi:hypothetical protein